MPTKHTKALIKARIAESQGEDSRSDAKPEKRAEKLDYTEMLWLVTRMHYNLRPSKMTCCNRIVNRPFI